MTWTEGEPRVLVKVWDWPTRVLHWANVMLISGLILLHFFAEFGEEYLKIDEDLLEPVNKLHAIAGHILIATVFLRIIWGFLGNRYARFSDMMPIGKQQRREIIKNIKWYLSGFSAEPCEAKGHDPLAAIFYMILFIVLILMSFTGLVLSGIEFEFWPGVWIANLFGGGEMIEDIAEEMHEAGFFYIIFFIAAHVFGLVAHELKAKTGLFSSMIHGRKYFPGE